MPDGEQARGWDIDKSRLLGVIDRLHATISGLITANQLLADTNKELLQALADSQRRCGPAPPQVHTEKDAA